MALWPINYPTRTFTVAELIAELQAVPQKDLPIKMLDADTGWTIPKFAVEKSDDCFWIMPCDFCDMEDGK